eukprot:1051217-Prymnesium_polylepis.1
MLGQAARPPWTSRAVIGRREAALSRATHILPAPTPGCQPRRSRARRPLSTHHERRAGPGRHCARADAP